MKGVKYFLYYSYSKGAFPGEPIEEIAIDNIPIISGYATNVCADKDSKQPYGNPEQTNFIHVKYERDPGSDFAYSFEILVLEEAGLNVYVAIQREFRDAVRKDYAAAFAVKDPRSIYVDIPVFEPQNDGTVKGRALVISATPVAVMDYDVHTRQGRMTVRFHSAIGTEAARKWARENIEKLARDKNILLTTGTKPPEGQYVSLGEKWRENTLEIAFRVE